MPMDAWRDGDTFVVELDVPGVAADSIDLDVERNVVTVRAERPGPAQDTELLAAERPRGYSAARSFSVTPSTLRKSRPATTLGC
jgi:HSP20 family molecular chaperone IbpA